jgi:uncharacterized membrane protein
MKDGLMARLRRYLLTGLLVLVPIALTFWVLDFFVSSMDRVLDWLPHEWQPRHLLGVHIPGFGVLLVVLLVLVVGTLAHNIIGRKVVEGWNRLLGRIPIVRGLYSTFKQVSDTLFSENGNAFREAVLVQYPRQGAWTVAFVTGRPGGEVADLLPGDYVSVYVPTTPNPTSGFFLMLPRSDVKALDMSVDEALKYVISMGVVAPLRRSMPASLPPSGAQAAGGARNP